MVRSWLSFGLAVTAGLCNPARADINGTDPKEPIETISVTATRNPTDAFEFPGMVTVIGPDDISLLQASTPDDLLKFVPNVEFTGGPRRTGETPSIRGFSGSDLVIMIDGARQNFGAGHDGRFFLDPTLLRQVEVLRGSSSSLYGSGGTGGVMEFRTAGARDFLPDGRRFGGALSGGYQGVNDEAVGTVSLYVLPTANTDLLGSFTKRGSGTIELGDGSELDNTDDDISSAFVKAGYDFSDTHRIEFSFRRFDNEAEEPNNGQGLGGSDQVEKDLLSQDLRLAYRYRDPDNALIDLDVVAYSTQYEADELRLDALGAGPDGELLRRDVDTLGFRLDNRSRFALTEGIATTFTYGVEYYQDDQNGAAGATERAGVPDAESDFLGVFLQAEIEVEQPFGVLPGSLLLLPGVRYDDYESSSDLADDNDESNWSPRIAVNYSPVEWGLAFVSYGDAFRAPSMDELYLTGVHFAIPNFIIPNGAPIINRFIPNPDLKPQSTTTLEYGAGLNFSELLGEDTLHFKVSRFHIDGDDFINLSVTQPELEIFPCFIIPGSCDGTTNSANVADAKLKGTEIEASYDHPRFRFSLGYGHIHGRDQDTGEPIGSLAPDQLSFIGAVKVPEVDAIVGWRMLAAEQFDQVSDPAEIRDGYVVNDVFIAWQPDAPALAGFRLDLGIDNVFDKKYERVFNDVVEPGRNFKVLGTFSRNW